MPGLDLKIKSLHINNFKYFGYAPAIEIDSKHVLIYGENGSGKSSLFWSLYTLLESSLKRTDMEIVKYFGPPITPDSLVNIHAEPDNNYNSFVKAVLSNNTELKISATETAIKDDDEIKPYRYASDFLNYRFLLKIHDFKKSEDIDLFQLFVDEIFDYLYTFYKYKNRLHKLNFVWESISSIWNLIKDGPEYVYNEAQKKVPPYKGTPEYKEYDKLINQFNGVLTEFSREINTTGNQILEEYFKVGFQFYLDYKPIVRKGRKEIEGGALILKIPTYEGKTDTIAKPQLFLNEAKLTAIALSIRFAILENHLQDADLKILCLDDILVSLDMSNRDKVLKLLFERYSTRYQIFFFTHDRYLYEYIKRKYSTQLEADWNILEVYSVEKEINEIKISSPVVVSGCSSFLADGLRNVHSSDRPDYPAAASYFRKYAEEILCNFLPEEYSYNIDKENDTLVKIPSFAIKDIQKKTKQFLKTIKQSETLINRLGDELYLLMHPLSHSYLEHPIFKSELIKVSELLQELYIFLNTTKSKFKAILFQGNWIKTKIETAERGNFYYDLKIKDTVFVYENPSNNTLQFSDTTFHHAITYHELTPTRISKANQDIDNYTSIEDAYLKIKAVASTQNLTVANVTDYVSIFEYKRIETDNWQPLSNLKVL